jgi:hypothetical protein
MIEIYDRAEFKDKFAHLMAADINLMHAGIDPKSDTMSVVIDAFLNQFEASTIARAPEQPEKDPIGYIIRDRWDGREIEVFRGTLYVSEEAATASIEQAYSRPDFNEFDILPVYL